jgi:hypothetical protein
MKKIILIFFTGILIFGVFSCTPESVTNSTVEYQDCCGDDEDQLPPPPPPNGN